MSISINVVKESKESKDLNQLKTSSEYSSLFTATKRHDISSSIGKKMFSISIQKKVENEKLVDRVKYIQSNPIIQTAMKQNYIEFVKQLSQPLSNTSSSSQ